MTNTNGRFGVYGGQYITETLMNAVIELEAAYDKYKADADFNAELCAACDRKFGRRENLSQARRFESHGRT